ncbi:MAG: hypothetical protein ACI8W3_002029 [Myxococcota bacterium]|jgi:uncharacterized protein (DUF1330 family)
MPSIEIETETLERFYETVNETDPVVMINLLRYREQASYAADFPAEPCTGSEAYGRYGALVTGLIAEAKGHVVWAGNPDITVIGPKDESWDLTVLVQYPSRAAFLGMVESDTYRKAAHHRTAGLADSRLIATKTIAGPFTR